MRIDDYYRLLYRSCPYLILPIRAGELRGMLWTLGATELEAVMGIYEAAQTRLLGEEIEPTDTVYDIGANVGYYTLLMSKLAKRVLSFEPLPRNLRYLRRHRLLNLAKNVKIIDRAVSSDNGKTRFFLGENHAMGHMYTPWTDALKDEFIEVQQIRLDGSGLPAPDVMKIDVEGAELQVLKGAKDTIECHHPTIFLSVHSDNLRKECTEFLHGLGYNMKPIEGDAGLAYICR